MERKNIVIGRIGLSIKFNGFKPGTQTSEDIDMLSKEVQNEPRIALDGGIDGLDFYREIICNGREYILL